MMTDGLIIKGDCLSVMAGLPAASIDAIVTDPPYALTNRIADVPACDCCGRQCGGSDKVKPGDPCPRCGEILTTRRTMTGAGFMGKDWDNGLVAFSPETWREALRVAKPGCHILAAGGSRTYHRLAVAIEDAGWEIRDSIIWMYGSGFPKSLDVSKAIDKAAGAEREVVGPNRYVGRRTEGSGPDNGDACYGQYGIPAGETAPATEAARQWQGWGTALKPAYEPFILARKPLDGTVASNLQRHGCGAINVDGCRVGTNAGWSYPNGRGGSGWHGRESLATNLTEPMAATQGRWPANLIHDGSDEVVACFPETHGAGTFRQGSRAGNTFGVRKDEGQGKQRPALDNGGSAARFFYVPKADSAEREEGLNGLEEKAAGSLKMRTDEHSVRNGMNTAPARNHHPTVKPVNLMAYLCKLITPPDGLILDPFCGSGSTGVAAIREGFNFVGIELNGEYAEIAKRRIQHERNKTPLFSEVI